MYICRTGLGILEKNYIIAWIIHGFIGAEIDINYIIIEADDTELRLI